MASARFIDEISHPETKNQKSEFCIVLLLEFNLREGKGIFILQSALPFENLKVYEQMFKGHQWPRPAVDVTKLILT